MLIFCSANLVKAFIHFKNPVINSPFYRVTSAYVYSLHFSLPSCMPFISFLSSYYQTPISTIKDHYYCYYPPSLPLASRSCALPLKLMQFWGQIQTLSLWLDSSVEQLNYILSNLNITVTCFCPLFQISNSRESAPLNFLNSLILL